MEKIKQIKNKLDKISGQGTDSWYGLEDNVIDTIDNLLLEVKGDLNFKGSEEISSEVVAKIMTLFRAYLDSGIEEIAEDWVNRT